MLLERYYDDALAQASYLIACQTTGEAIVIDPNRDVERYVAAAKAHKVRIAWVTETHIHADFLSGSRELARATNARLLLSAHGGPDWSYTYAAGDGAKLLRDGDQLAIGRVRIDVLHTPGHTPEHICFLVTDTAAGDRPMGLISGDFIFVGDVGRPDLLERAANVAGSMEGAARQLFASLRRTASLADYLQLWPGHGSGSACGKALGAVPQSTLGYERLFNPAFRSKTEDDFVRWVLADQPEPPPYFATMKRLNRDGPPARATTTPEELDARAVGAAFDAGNRVVDARGSLDFAKRHIAGSINIPSSNSFATYAGTVLDYDHDIVLIVRNAQQVPQLVRQLSLIGMDRVRGWAPASVVDDAAHGRPVDALELVDAETLAKRLETNGTQVVDVRGHSEWTEAHLEHATHMYLGDVARRAGELRRDQPVVVHCATGTRSSIGASLLRAAGFQKVANLRGGIDEWIRRGLPIVKGE